MKNPKNQLKARRKSENWNLHEKACKMHEFRILIVCILVFHQSKSSTRNSNYCDSECLCYKDIDHLEFFCERGERMRDMRYDECNMSLDESYV